MKIRETVKRLLRRQPLTAEELAARAEGESERAEAESVRDHDQLLGDGEQARRW